jgi:hypothetical protein
VLMRRNEARQGSAPDEAKARALFEYIYGNFKRDPLMKDDVLMGSANAAATLDLRVVDEYLHIQSVETLDSGLGGSVALRQLCELADKFGVWLHLNVHPFRTEKQYIKTARKLVQWYEHFGFKRKDLRTVHGVTMIRAPRGEAIQF